MKNIFLALVASAFLAAPSAAQVTASVETASLIIAGAVERPLELHISDLEKMPHTRIEVKDHDGNPAMYEGVGLVDVLKSAGAPIGDKLRGAGMASYVLAQAKDGYRVVFALPELDPAFTDAKVLVAYSLNGKPLPEGQGPLRIVAPQDKRPARWIRMLQRIEVVKLP